MSKANTFKYDSNNNGKRWVSFFDILGFKQMCQQKHPREIFSDITTSFESLNERKRRQWIGCLQFEFIYFSDSFVIYSSVVDDNPDNPTFAGIERSSRLFIERLTQKGIPVRGAMSFGDFYVDKTYGIFYGKALVEAYELAESCNWLGFVICPSSIKRMEMEGCSIDKHKSYRQLYKEWQIPTSASKTVHAACLLGISQHTLQKEKLFRSLETMKKRVEKPEHKIKYENTLTFLNHFNVP